MYKNEDKAFLKFPEYITPVSVIEHDFLNNYNNNNNNIMQLLVYGDHNVINHYHLKYQMHLKFIY